jgi:prepilin-type N-terminal cleavage/methylation domain-containing protein
MNDRSRQNRRGGRGSRPIPAGFTLLEVVVAITLLGVVLGIALELMAVGLRSAKASGDYTEAVLLARRKIQEISLQELTPRTLAGAGDVYSWTAEITPADGEAQDLPAQLLALRVKVSWSGKGGGKGVELVTLRLAGEPPTVGVAASMGSQSNLSGRPRNPGGATSGGQQGLVR